MSLSVEDIKDYKTLDISNIVFSDPKKTRGSYISLGYHNDSSLQPLVIQTPKLKICGGINKSETRAFIDLEFDKSHWAFYEFMTSIDEHNIIYIQKHSKKWFNKSFPLDVVDDFYTTPVKTARKKNPPKLKLKLPISKGMIDTNIYDLGNNLIDYRDVISDSKIVATIKLLGLRFLKQQVICEWVPLQLKIYQEPNINNKVNGYLINNNLLSDDEEENITDLNLEVQEETENIESNNESSDNQVDTSESNTLIQESDNQESDNKVDTSEPDSENQEPLINESNNQESMVQESDNKVGTSESYNQELDNQESIIQESMNQESMNQELDNQESDNQESMNQESDNQVNESDPDSENLETEIQKSDNQVDESEPEKVLQESINSDSQDEGTSDITDSSNKEELIENDESDDIKEYEPENIIIDIDEPDLEELMFESNDEIPEAYQKIIDNTKKELEEQKRINMEQSSKIEELKNKISEIFNQFKNPL